MDHGDTETAAAQGQRWWTTAIGKKQRRRGEKWAKTVDYGDREKAAAKRQRLGKDGGPWRYGDSSGKGARHGERC